MHAITIFILYIITNIGHCWNSWLTLASTTKMGDKTTSEVKIETNVSAASVESGYTTMAVPPGPQVESMRPQTVPTSTMQPPCTGSEFNV